MLLASVIRSEDALAFFASQAGSSVGDFHDDLAVGSFRAQSERAALRHGVHRVKHQVRDRAVQQFRVGRDGRNPLVKFEFACDRRASGCLQLRLKKLRNAAHEFVHRNVAAVADAAFSKTH